MVFYVPNDQTGEAIEKMLLEKRISTKINYEVLKNLNSIGGASASSATDVDEKPAGSKLLKIR